jgi:hypothetical protein
MAQTFWLLFALELLLYASAVGCFESDLELYSFRMLVELLVYSISADCFSSAFFLSAGLVYFSSLFELFYFCSAEGTTASVCFSCSIFSLISLLSCTVIL